MNGVVCRAVFVGYGGVGRGGREECDVVVWYRYGGSRFYKGGRVLKRFLRFFIFFRSVLGFRFMIVVLVAVVCILFFEYRYISFLIMFFLG